MNVPKDQPLSKDLIDRRHGEKPTLMDKARDVVIKVRTDWNDMKEAEKKRKGEKDTAPKAAYEVPSFKKGGMVRKTGLIYAHKGERVIPKHKVAKMFKKGR